jgi:hypothetical protein
MVVQGKKILDEWTNGRAKERRLNNTNQYVWEKAREKTNSFFSLSLFFLVRFCSSRQTRTMMSFFQANEHDTSCWESRKINNRLHQMEWNSILRWPLYRNNGILSPRTKLISVICIQAEFFAMHQHILILIRWSFEICFFLINWDMIKIKTTL